MIIKYIIIENFLSYYSSGNRFDFDSGSTLIIGQNRTGKSKLFDAFYWAFYDKAYNTDIEKWETTKELNELLVNNLAKRDCPIKDTVNVSVELSFVDEQGNDFLLTRDFSVKKQTSTSWDSNRFSELSLTKVEARTGNALNYFNKEAEAQLRFLFPENLSKYFLFQGENIGQIMSLTNRSDFTKALRDLSRIEVFERAKNITQRVFKKIEKELQDSTDRDEETQISKKVLKGNIDNPNDEIETLNERIENNIKERDIAKQNLDRKEIELSKFKECAEIIEDIKSLEISKHSKNDIRNKYFENKKNEVFSIWQYAGSENILISFLNFYKKNKTEKKIPEPIRQDFIREMLDEEHCKICDRTAIVESREYLHIKSYINDKSLDKEIELINKLAYVADSTLNKVNSISEEISSFYSDLEVLDNEIQDLDNAIKVKKNEFKTVKPAGYEDEELEKINFEQMKIDRDKFDRDIYELERKINVDKGKKESKSDELEKQKKDYEALIEGSSNINESEKYFLSEKINDYVYNFYDSFLLKLIKDIEEEANNYFRKMTVLNPALSGNVKVDYELKEVYTIDEKGFRLFNINQANKVSLQISFVAAVLSVSNRFWNTHFPFIADAPISALGGNNKLTAIETMIEIFGQSIIILKDDAIIGNSESIKNDPVRKLILSNGKISKSYELSIEGATIDEQKTIINELK